MTGQNAVLWKGLLTPVQFDSLLLTGKYRPRFAFKIKGSFFSLFLPFSSLFCCAYAVFSSSSGSQKKLHMAMLIWLQSDNTCIHWHYVSLGKLTRAVTARFNNIMNPIQGSKLEDLTVGFIFNIIERSYITEVFWCWSAKITSHFWAKKSLLKYDLHIIPLSGSTLLWQPQCLVCHCGNVF